MRESWLWRYVTVPAQPEDPSWHDRAECRGLDLAMFFPDAATARTTPAYDACEVCSVRLQCLHETFAVERDMNVQYIDGIKGGLPASARRDFLKAHPELRGRGVAA